MTTIYTDKGKAPVEKEWTTERVIEVLEEVGHKIIKVEETKKKVKKAV